MARPNTVSNTFFSKAVLGATVSVPSGVLGLGGVTPYKRFSVYRNNVASSLIEAMAANFPAVKRLVGKADFSRITLAYIHAHPPESPILIRLGSAFALFLEEFEPVESLPHLADVARVEYAWLQSYHAADFPVLDRALLTTIDPTQLSNMVLSAHSAAWLYRSNWSAATIVAGVHSNSEFNETDIDGVEAILITRRHLNVEMRVLQDASFEFHTSLAEGRTLEHASNYACNIANDRGEEFDLANEISQLLQFGAFTRSVSFESQTKKA